MIRVFIGTDRDIHVVAERVIHYSILKHTEEEVEINFIRPGWKSGVTGFTTHRYLVPSLCNFEGYAIYLDVDMVVLADIAELWKYREKGEWVTTPMRDDVSVIDCSAFTNLTEIYVKHRNKGQLQSLINYKKKIPLSWNTIDEVQLDSKLVHYSDLDTQPWRFNHPNKAARDLFYQYEEESRV